MKNLNFLKNAAILTVTGLILRALGMVLRIYISARIGEEGMGVYQLISSVYFLFITIAQSGIAVIITKLCSARLALGDNEGAYGVVKSGVTVAAITGTVACLSLLILSKPLCIGWVGDIRALKPLRILSFSLPFIAICGVLSAYFMSMRNVNVGCSAQILEQLVRIGVVILVAIRLADSDMSAMLSGVFAATTLSEATSCIYLGLRVMFGKSRYPNAHSVYKRHIIKESTPVAASRYLASALHTAENMLVPSAAALYYGTRTVALSAFGALKGMTLPLLFFPSSFLSAISSLLIPEITSAYARNDRRSMSNTVTRTCFITLTLSVMISGGFMLFSNELGTLVYNSSQVSVMLLLLAPIVPFMYLDSICDGMLKALGKQHMVFMHGCIDSGIRIILVFLIVPHYGIYGFVGVMAFSNILVSILNFRLLLKTTNIKCNFSDWIIKPLVSVTLSAILTKFIFINGATLPKTVLSFVIFCSVFVIFMLIFHPLKKDCKNN